MMIAGRFSRSDRSIRARLRHQDRSCPRPGRAENPPPHSMPSPPAANRDGSGALRWQSAMTFPAIPGAK